MIDIKYILVLSCIFSYRNSLKSTPLVIVESADNSIESDKAITSSDVTTEIESQGKGIF